MDDKWRQKRDTGPGFLRMTAPISAEDQGETFVFQVEAGSLVLDAMVVVIEPFAGRGQAPVLTMGDGSDRRGWIAPGDVDLAKVGLYRGGKGAAYRGGKFYQGQERCYVTLETDGELMAGRAYGLFWIVKLDVGG